MHEPSQNLFVRFFTSSALFVVCLILLALISYSLAKEYVRRNQVNQEISQLQSEIDSLDAKSGELKKLAKYLKTESYIEKEARMNLGLKKVGESVMIIPEDVHAADDIQSAFESQYPQTDDKVSQPMKWAQYFFPLK